MELWNVRGEVHPADLFTKHLAADRITELLNLFGCHMAGGRSEGAPLLRKSDEKPLLAAQAPAMKTAEQMRYSVDELTANRDGYMYPSVRVEQEEQPLPDAYLHDASVLPHMIPGNLLLMFPRVYAAKDPENGAVEAADWLEELAAKRGLINASSV